MKGLFGLEQIREKNIFTNWYYFLLLNLVFLFIVTSGYAMDVTLQWDPNSEPDLAGYRLFYRGEGQSYNYSNPSWEGTDTTCTIYDLDETETYYFVARSYDTEGFESGDSNEACFEPGTTDNQPPISDAGPDQTVNEGRLVTLNGSNSTDPDDGIASYLWTQISGPTVTLSNPFSAQPTFAAPDVGPDGASLSFNITVTDTGGLKDTDECIVNISRQNEPPTAVVAEEYIEDDPGTTVTLDGSGSTDADGGIVSYLWTQPEDSPVTLSDPTSDVTTFIAPETDQYGSNFSFQLTVTDFEGLQSTADCFVYITPENGPATVILEAHFDNNEDGFSYVDDSFRNTSQPSYADGTWIASGGFIGGALQVTLGGINDADILDMSGGWQQDFTLSIPTEVVLSFRYKLTQASDYEYDELSQVLMSVNHILYGEAPNEYVVQIVGNGNGGISENTGWQLFEVNLGILDAGDHTLIIGGYNNKKTYNNESTEVLIDEVLVESFGGSNQAPNVDAGSDQTIILPADTVDLDATCTDDGLPSGVLNTVWSQVNGPANQVVFDDAYAIQTTARFLSAGIYVLQLTADDGDLTAGDQITITVNEGGNVFISEVQVASGSDDAEESVSGYVRLTSSDLELVYTNSNQTVGIRFNSVDVPHDATIVNAYVQFMVDETSSEATSLTIEGEDIDNAATFISSSGNISSRARTSANMSWSPAVWTTVGEAGSDQRTPDVSRIIQEIVDRPGWSRGNSLVVIITGTGKRVAESYNGNQSGAPMLHVEYATGSASNQAPVVDAGSDDLIILPIDTVTLDGTVTDDGLPTGVLTTVWSQISGPANQVVFDNVYAIQTTARFLSAGTYVLQLTADDGDLTAGDQITIMVNEAESRIEIEAENMPVKTTGGSTSEGWNIWSNGYIADTVDFPTGGTYTFEVRARGSYAGGGWPIMEVRIDQNEVGTVTVDASSWAVYTIQAYVSSGTHEVAIAFTNDYYRPPQDRNLYVDKVTIYP
jgi:Ca-dependent carbohydrate-binding module xylan-binding/K319L-like, PKD domain